MSKPLNLFKPQFCPSLPNAGLNLIECGKDDMRCQKCLAQSTYSANNVFGNRLKNEISHVPSGYFIKVLAQQH